MTAERQMWEEAARREREHVENTHAKARKMGKKSSAEYSPNRAAKPWSWSSAGPGPLFELDDDMISAVYSFDYNLDDERFVTFLDQAAQLHICRKKGSSYWSLLQRKTTTPAEFLDDPEMQYAQQFNGQRYRYSDDELTDYLYIFVRTRVYLQGAYDAYIGRVTEPLEHEAYKPRVL